MTKVDYENTDAYKLYMKGVISVHECRDLLAKDGFTSGPRIEMDRMGRDTTTGYRSRD
tara:strand:- start:1651 stop:1824 length:174 start_codon:yes stop_codon:yes gene_type:complete